MQLRRFTSVQSFASFRTRVKCSSMAQRLPLIAFVPQLSMYKASGNHKGQHGKVGIVGGCEIYTGAPFFAAQSSLLVGADLAWVFCTKSAAPIIKSYSPDLMVLPYLPEEDENATEERQCVRVEKVLTQIQPWLRRLSCLVVGPGLGDDPLVQATALSLIKEARALNLPLVIDGSAFNLFSPDNDNIDIIRGYKRLILTPNISELGRLAKAAGIELDGPMGSAWQKEVNRIGESLDGPMILSKGPQDVISDDSNSILDGDRQPRRCGGQGDILAGSLGTFLSWTMNAEVGMEISEGKRLAAACIMASRLTRMAALAAFEDKGRSMRASDMLETIPLAISKLLEQSFYHFNV